MARLNRKQYPLRKVVSTIWLSPYHHDPVMLAKYADSTELLYELLECGHVQRPLQDHIGETNANRRRCGKCFRGEAPFADLKQKADECRS